MKHFLKYDYGLWTLELVTLLVHSVSFFNSLFQRAYFDQRRAKPPIRPWLGTMYQLRPMYHVMGIATGQVQVGFLYIRTRSTGLYPLPESGPFNKRVFFLAPNSALQVSVGPVQPLLGLIRGPIRPNLIKKKQKQKLKHKQQHKSINIVISLVEMRFLDRK